jgi:surface protein
MFSGCTSLRYVANTVQWDLKDVTSLESTFEGCTVFNPGNENQLLWDTANILSMKKMFLNCTYYDTDISQFNTGNVRDMSSMFENAVAFDQRIESWNVGNVLDMSNMFSRAIKFNQSLSNWERIVGLEVSTLSNVTNMSGMFNEAFEFNQDISNWDISSVEDLTNFMAYKDATNYTTTNYDALLNKNIQYRLSEPTNNLTDWMYNPVTKTTISKTSYDFDKAKKTSVYRPITAEKLQKIELFFHLVQL